MVGERVYDHMHELHERGLVNAREHGQTNLLTTSERSPESFGIPETEPERIRTFLAEKLGIKVGPKKKEVPPEVTEADVPLGGEAVATVEGAPQEESPSPPAERPGEPVAPPA